MIEFVFIASAVLLAIAMTIFNRKKESGHQNKITQLKSEIADSTNMTAKIAVFSDGRRMAGIIAAAEEMSLFFYYRVVGQLVPEKYTLGFERIIQARLYINGLDVLFDSPKLGIIPSAFAHEVSTSSIAMPDGSSPEMARSITLEITYRGEDQNHVLNIKIMNVAPNGEAREKAGKMVENAIWWAAFLKAASTSGQKQAEEEAVLNADPMAMTDAQLAASHVDFSSHKTVDVPENHK